MKDLVIVITGASAGIGAAVAELVGQRGAKPVLLARRESQLNAVAQRCGPHAQAIVADVTVRADVQRALEQTLARHAQLDVWINNAGRGITRMVSELTDADLDEMITANVKSALYGMQAVLPHFRQRQRGHIINVSSMLGRVPFAPFRSAYSASKHALGALTANLRMELRPLPNIHVSTVYPGIVATEFGVNALHGGVDSRAIASAQTAEQVAEVIADMIEHPRAEAYTRPEGAKVIAQYYSAEDIAAAEAAFTFVPPHPPT